MLAARIGGEIIICILHGHSLLGLLAPATFHAIFLSIPPAPLQMLSQIGLEFDFGHR